jgi:dTDP-4-dehydrorhamnose 3,5-epimerase
LTFFLQYSHLPGEEKMKITHLQIEGVAVIDLEYHEDARGFFARTFCREEFTAAGLEPTVEQCNLSYNRLKGTLRGMHYQTAPAPEAKLVRCIRGAIHDVAIDLREGSSTYLQHVAIDLTEDNRLALYVPAFFAHGYQTLSSGAEVAYQVSRPYTPSAQQGLRHDDPALGIKWPLPVNAISARDVAWPLLTPGQVVGKTRLDSIRRNDTHTTSPGAPSSSCPRNVPP